MQISGSVSKLFNKLDTPVQYSFVLNKQLVALNDKLGCHIQLKYFGEINCVACGKKTNKSYSNGYCFICAKKLAQCDLCILKPELCHFVQGTCREPVWGEKNCFIPHIVYLANSSGLKVGISRESQIPTRWIDQGAVQALAICRVQSRYQSGLIEVAIAESVSDKTNWRKMLRGDLDQIDLVEKRNEILCEQQAKIQKIAEQFTFGAIELLFNEQLINIQYPVLEYPTVIKSLNLDKTPIIEGILIGIKGQYLIFDIGVLNVRNLTGYKLELSVK